MNIKYYRRQKNVNRLGTIAITRPYNLLEHSYMVTVLFCHFAKLEGIPYDVDTIDRIMHHDIVETITGDLPYPIKHSSSLTEEAWAMIEKDAIKDHPDLKPYTDEVMESVFTAEQLKLFKMCDLLDLWIFLKEEYSMGNSTTACIEIIDRCETWIRGNFKSIDDYMFKNHYVPILLR